MRAMLAIAVGLALLAPTTFAVVTGRPLSVDCGGLESAACDDAWRDWADRVVGEDNVGFGPITWVKIAPISGTSPLAPLKRIAAAHSNRGRRRTASFGRRRRPRPRQVRGPLGQPPARAES